MNDFSLTERIVLMRRCGISWWVIEKKILDGRSQYGKRRILEDYIEYIENFPLVAYENAGGFNFRVNPVFENAEIRVGLAKHDMSALVGEIT